MNEKHSVTVGIPTKDRFDELKKCLQSTLIQTLLPIEIIIVDDGNLTREQQNNLGSIIEPAIKFVYVKKDKPSLAASKNLIAKLSKGDLVLTLDDDTIMSNDYIENLVSVFLKDSNGRIAAVGGIIANKRHRSIFEKIWRKIFLLNNSIPCSLTDTMFETRSFKTKNECKVKWLPGGITMFRRGVLNKYPFEEFQGGRNCLEDLEIALKITKEYDYVVTPSARIYHYPSKKGRESLKITGFKHAYNRCVLFKKYGRKGFNRILFAWSFLGYILGLTISGKFSTAKGNLAGIGQFLRDSTKSLV
jgi:GT2 family glycosyltransferase